MNPNADTIAWSVLLGVLVALTIFFFLNRRNKAGKIPRRSIFLYSTLAVAVFLVTLAGVWLAFLWSSGSTPSIPTVKFPSTGLGPTTLPVVKSFVGVRPTPRPIDTVAAVE